MGDKNRSRHNQTVEDVDSKLKQYMIINKQISKTLTVQRCEIANLKKLLRVSTSDIINLRMDCHKWRNKFLEIRKMFIVQIQSITIELQTNADKINSLSDDCTVVAADNDPLDELLASPINTDSRSVDSTRRVSKSFEPAKNRSDKGEYLDVDTIVEENEDVNSIESTSKENARDYDSKEEDIAENRNDEESVENVEESQTEYSVSNVDESNESTEKSVETEEDCKDNTEESVENEEESKESLDEENLEDSKESIEEPEDSEEENCDSAEESDEESGRESDESYQENDISNEETETDASSEVENDSVSKVDVDDTCDLKNRTESVQEISSFTTDTGSTVQEISSFTKDSDSTIRNDDSEKENNNFNSTKSISRNGRSVLRVVTNQSNDNLASLKKLQANKQNMNSSHSGLELQDKSIDNTFGSMKAQSLVSSTPYRNNKSSDDESVTNTNSLISSGNATSESQCTLTSSRPRRKAAPVILAEPKLNTKLRRPRNYNN